MRRFFNLGERDKSTIQANRERFILTGLPALKWLAFLLPVAFASVFLYLTTGVLHELSRNLTGFLLLLGVLAGTIAIFTKTIFGLIERLHRALIQQNWEMESLLALGQQLVISLDIEEILGRAIQAVVKATSAEAVEIWLVDQRNNQIVMRQCHGKDAGLFMERTVFPPGEGIPGLVASTGEPVIIHDLSNDKRFLREAVKVEGYKTYCAFPLRPPQRIVGVMGLASRSSQALSQIREKRLVEAMCDHVAMAVENALLHEQVQHLAVLTERERIARELHDGMAQVLTYVNTKALAVDRLLVKGDKELASQQLQQLADTARKLYTDVREAILSLRTQVSDNTDLVNVLKQYVGEIQSLSGLPIHFQQEAAPEELALLPPAKEIQVLRIVQEALTNIRKHAQATQAWLIVRSDGSGLEINVKDNGRGFDPQNWGVETGPASDFRAWKKGLKLSEGLY